MSACCRLKLFFYLILLNFIVVLGFLSCFLYSQENCDNPKAILLFCAIALLLANFLFFTFIARIMDDNINSNKQKGDFDNQIDNCLNKISQNYNLIEASRISFGIYHDLSNILTSSNLALSQILYNLENGSTDIKLLVEKNMKINEQANCLIKSFKQQCQKNDEKIEFYPALEIKKVLDVFHFQFVKYNIQINLDLDFGIKIFNSPVKFIQVMINLINNAIDSFEPDKKEDQVRGHDFKKKRNFIFIKLKKVDNFKILSIKDSGCGMEGEVVDKIFDPFFSLKDKKEDNSNNYHCGVGLSIVRKIIEDDFCGKIEVESKIGQGTEFIIKF